MPEPALSRTADLCGDDEVDGFEDADVLLDTVEREPVGLGELADGGRAVRPTARGCFAGSGLDSAKNVRSRVTL